MSKNQQRRPDFTLLQAAAVAARGSGWREDKQGGVGGWWTKGVVEENRTSTGEVGVKWLYSDAP